MKKNTSLVISILLIAACLRGPVTGIGPLITTLQADLGLSAAAAGMLTTLPLLTFAAISFATSPISRKIGAGRTMLISLIVLLAGLVIRSFAGTVGLFAGTVIMSVGRGVNNVLLPAVIKAKFPEHIGILTGVYTTLLAGFASLSTGTSIPLALIFGWRIALAVWIVLVVFALIFWIPDVNLKFDDKENPSIGTDVADQNRSVLRSPVSWWITLFMGFQSMVFYFTVAWFATILQGYGYTPAASGLYNMLMMLCGLPGSFIMSVVTSKTRHQSLWGAILGILYLIGSVTLMFAYHPAWLVATIVTNGFGSGASLSFTMVLINMRTRNPQEAASLSALAQGVGYVLAAISPVLIGRIFDSAGSWTIPIVIAAAFSAVTAVCGWLSGTKKA